MADSTFLHGDTPETNEPVRCDYCGSTREHVEIMALFAGINDPICCDDSAWGQQ